ncbi:MAG: hypothetical protein OEO82_01230 [Gammaproteobacteria bacterium]|nr:hypothetical protein [Gammaproteobacteria bacterium]
MKFFNRLHNRCAPAGLELVILKKLPLVLLIGTLLPVALSVLVRIWPVAGGDVAKHVASVDIFAIAATITFLTGVFTVAIGCVVVFIMKGPAYVADPYPLEHADRPEGGSTD